MRADLGEDVCDGEALDIILSKEVLEVPDDVLFDGTAFPIAHGDVRFDNATALRLQIYKKEIRKGRRRKRAETTI